jgi:hypothetical protein
VTDPDSAGLPGATVMLIVRDNRLRTTSHISGDGSYRLDRVAAGDYGHCVLHLKWRLDAEK